MQKLCGKSVAKHLLAHIEKDIKKEIEDINFRKPKFAIIQVGDNSASNLYISNKKKVAYC